MVSRVKNDKPAESMWAIPVPSYLVAQSTI